MSLRRPQQDAPAHHLVGVHIEGGGVACTVFANCMQAKCTPLDELAGEPEAGHCGCMSQPPLLQLSVWFPPACPGGMAYHSSRRPPPARLAMMMIETMKMRPPLKFNPKVEQRGRGNSIGSGDSAQPGRTHVALCLTGSCCTVALPATCRASALPSPHTLFMLHNQLLLRRLQLAWFCRPPGTSLGRCPAEIDQPA